MTATSNTITMEPLQDKHDKEGKDISINVKKTGDCAPSQNPPNRDTNPCEQDGRTGTVVKDSVFGEREEHSMSIQDQKMDECGENDSAEVIPIINVEQSQQDSSKSNVADKASLLRDFLVKDNGSNTPSSSVAVSSASTSPMVLTPSATSIESPASAVRLTEKKKSARKPTPKSMSDSLLDESDLEHLRIPFKHGWRREIVYRNVTDPKNKRSMCDVYYFPPTGKKLRSMVEIGTFLDAQKNCPVNLTHFTFKRQVLFGPPGETVRTAGKPNRKPEDSRGAPGSSEKPVKKKTVVRRSTESTRKEKDIRPRIIYSLKQLQTKTTSNGLSESTVTPSTLATTTSSQAPTSYSMLSHGKSPGLVGQSPVSKHSCTVRLSDPLKHKIRKKVQKSPDWKPSSSEDSDNSALSEDRDVEIIKESVGPPGSSDDDDEDNFQSVLGTPSKLIASIVRPEAQKRPLEDRADPDQQCIKKIKVMKAILPKSSAVFSTCASEPVSVPRYAHPEHGQMVQSVSSTVSAKGVGMPSQQCAYCKCLFPGTYSGLDTSQGSLCPACIGKKIVILPPVRPGQQAGQMSRFYIPLSNLKGQGVGPSSNPLRIPSSTLSSVSQLSKSLSTPPLSLPGGLVAPIVLVPGQTSSTIPPPPPLASCPRYNITLPLSGLGTTMPAPPRLLLGNIPSISQLPPLILAGTPVHTAQETVSGPGIGTLPRPPSLQPCLSSVVSKSGLMGEVTGVTTVTTIATAVSAISPSATSVSHPVLSSKLGPKKHCVKTDNVNNKPVAPCTQNNEAVNSKPVASCTQNDKAAVIHIAESDHSESDGQEIICDDESVPTSAGVQKAVKNVKYQRHPSTSDSDDMENYPPVSFDTPAADDEHDSRQILTTGTVQALDAAGDSRIQPVNCQKGWESMLGSNITFPNINAEPTSCASDSHKKSEASLFQSSASAQLLTLPSLVTDKLDLKKPLALKINGTEFIVPACDVLKTSDGVKILLPFKSVKLPSDPKSKLNVFISNNLSSLSFKSTSAPPSKADKQKPSRKDLLSSFQMMQFSFNVMLNIFGYLSIPDLLRASQVCKMWNRMAFQPCLWQNVDLEDVSVTCWKTATKVFDRLGVATLKVKVPATVEEEDENVWKEIKETFPSMTKLRELFFDWVPATVLDALTDKLPHHTNISARSITDSSEVTGPQRSSSKTVESMTKAWEAVTTGIMSSCEAASKFHVSEKDLVHLATTDKKLTDEEEKTAMLCCLRLIRMGFSVSIATFLGRCQEMFARRFSTETSVPISDTYCRDLYYRNVPLFSTCMESKSSDSLSTKLDAHYAALHKLYNSFLPRKVLTANQVLFLDLKTFALCPGHDLASAVLSVTVLSAASCSGTFLPLMLIWPKEIESTQPDLITVKSRRGMPTPSLLYQYIQKIRTIIIQRPLVIFCNGNSFLYSEKLVSACVNDSVYFHCVPSDIAKYVFPGCHGGLLNMLRRTAPDHSQTGPEFISIIQALLSKKNYIAYDVRLAISATGVYPLNSKAPSQYQGVNLNVPSNICTVTRTDTADTEMAEVVTVDAQSDDEIKSKTDKKCKESSTDALETNSSDKSSCFVEGSTSEGDAESSSADKTQGKVHGVSGAPKSFCTEKPLAAQKQRELKKLRTGKHLHELWNAKKSPGIKKNKQIDRALSISQLYAQKLVKKARMRYRNATFRAIKLSGIKSGDVFSNYKTGEGVAHPSEIVNKCVKKLAGKQTRLMNGKAVYASLKELGSWKFSQTAAEIVDSSEQSPSGKLKSAATVAERVDEVISQVIAQSRAEYEHKHHYGETAGSPQKCQKQSHGTALHKRDSQVRRQTSVGKTVSKSSEVCEKNVRKTPKIAKTRDVVVEENGENYQSGAQCTGPVKHLGETGIELKTDEAGKHGVLPIEEQRHMKERAYVSAEDQVEKSSGDKNDDSLSDDGKAGCDENVGSAGSETDKERKCEADIAVSPSVVAHKRKKKKQYRKQLSDRQISEEDEGKGHSEEDTDGTPQFSPSKDKKRKQKKHKKSDRQISEEDEEKGHSGEDTNGTPQFSPSKDKKRKQKKHKKKKKKKKRRHLSETENETRVSAESHSDVQKVESASNIPHREAEKITEEEDGAREEKENSVHVCGLFLMDHDYVKPFDTVEEKDSKSITANAEKGEIPESSGAAEKCSDLESVATVLDDRLSVADTSMTRHSHSETKEDEVVVEDEVVAEETVLSSGKVNDSEEGNSSEAESDADSDSSSSTSCGSADSRNSSTRSQNSGNSSSHCSNSKTTQDSDSTSGETSDENSVQSRESEDGDMENDNKSSTNVITIRKQKLLSVNDCDNTNSSTSTDFDSSDDDENGSNKRNSASSDQEDEEEGDDDDSKCQLCMRTSPPHSKDELIDWVDCDGNCGRWFHVICIVRSQTKVEPKHYVCPSCRCKR